MYSEDLLGELTINVIHSAIDVQLPVKPVPITTKDVSSNPVHGEVYSIQHYVNKFVSDLRQVCGFPPISSINKTHPPRYN